MKSPRIYTYKVTFEEIPHWYWGVHKESKYNDGYMGSPTTHRWMWDFYTPHLQILELFPLSDDGWEEANRVEDRLILPDLNNPLCLNEGCNGYVSIETARKGGEIAGRMNAELKTGFCNPEYINSESCRESRSKTAKENVRKSRGLFSKDYLTSEKRKETHQKLGNLTLERQIGIFSPAYRESKEFVETRRQNMSRLNSSLYEDPDHPEIGKHSPGTLAQMQKRKGYPHGPENRVKVTQ
jgi:hypothetical protein